MQLSDALEGALRQVSTEALEEYPGWALEEALATTESLYTELERLHGVGTGLTRLLERHTTAGQPIDPATYQIALEMALWDTGCDAAQFYPSLESVDSTGRLKELIARIWRRFIEGFSALIRHFKHFWNLLTDEVGRTELLLSRLKYKAEATSGGHIREMSVVLHREANMISVRGQVVPSSEAINKGLVEVHRQLGVILGHHVDGVLAVGAQFADLLNTEKRPAQGFLERLINASTYLELPRTASALLVKPYKDNRFRVNEVLVAPPLLGNKSLFVRQTPLYSQEAPSLLSRAEATRGLGISLLYSLNDHQAITEHAFPTIAARDIVQMTVQMQGLLESIQAFRRTGRESKISALHDKVLASNLALKRWMDQNTPTETDLAYYNSAMKFASSFAKWSERPQEALIVHAIRLTQSVMQVCHKSLAQH